ncbi:MAG TPA: hypothetical protein VGM37_14635 [Armatimonadota bacterium]|jgi:hypothetical protein
MNSRWSDDHDGLQARLPRPADEPDADWAEVIRGLVRLLSLRRHPWRGVLAPIVIAFVVICAIAGLPIVVGSLLWTAR